MGSPGGGGRGHISRGGGGRGGISRGGGGRGGGGRGGGRRSDIRLKEDVAPLMRLSNGLELYRFRYKGNDHTLYVGVMAQDVQKIEPSAVSYDRDGYLMVDYDRIGLKFMTWEDWVAGPARGISHRAQSAPPKVQAFHRSVQTEGCSHGHKNEPRSAYCRAFRSQCSSFRSRAVQHP